MIGNAAATRGGSAPARYDSLSTVTWIGVGNANGTDIRTEAQRGFDANDGNIVDHSPGVVTLMVAESTHRVHTAARAPVGAANAYLQLVSGDGLQTVGGGDDDVVGVDGTTTEVGSVALQRHLVGMIIDAGLIATNNATIQLGQKTLRNGACQGAGGQGKKNHKFQHLFLLYSNKAHTLLYIPPKQTYL